MTGVSAILTALKSSRSLSPQPSRMKRAAIFASDKGSRFLSRCLWVRCPFPGDSLTSSAALTYRFRPGPATRMAGCSSAGWPLKFRLECGIISARLRLLTLERQDNL